MQVLGRAVLLMLIALALRSSDALAQEFQAKTFYDDQVIRVDGRTGGLSGWSFSVQNISARTSVSLNIQLEDCVNTGALGCSASVRRDWVLSPGQYFEWASCSPRNRSETSRRLQSRQPSPVPPRLRPARVRRVIGARHSSVR